MKRYDIDRQLIQNNLKGVRDNEVRRKVMLIIRVMISKSVVFGCDSNGLVRQTFYDWYNILKINDFNLLSLQTKSSKPHHSPNKTSIDDEKTVIRLHAKHGNSDRLLAYFFEQETGKQIGHSTICKILKRNNLSKKYKSPKPNSFNKRYSAPKPHDRAQSDTLWTGLTDNNGNRVYMIGIIDDCSRHAYGQLWDGKGGHEATETLKSYIDLYGKPKLVQTDNGVEFTYRYISELNHKRRKEPSKAGFEQHLELNKIKHHLIKPRTPQPLAIRLFRSETNWHNGKIERFNKTILQEFSSRVPNALSLNEYRLLFAKYLQWYNRKRHEFTLGPVTFDTY